MRSQGHVDALRADLKAIEKRIRALEKKASKRPGEQNRVKVLEGYLRRGDRVSLEGDDANYWTVSSLGKTWKEKFWANSEDVPLGVIFASGEAWRWASIQYAYLEADPDEDQSCS